MARLPIDASFPVDTANPFDRAAAPNQGRLAWWLGLPHLASGPTWYDLAGGSHGALTSFGAGYGWKSTTRPGGNAEVAFDGSTSHVVVPSFSYTGNSCTIAGWFLAAATQNVYTPGLNFRGGGSATTGFGVQRWATSVGYNWNDSTYNWDSGLTYPVGSWYFAAVAVTATAATVYLGAGGAVSSATNVVAHPSITLLAPWLGADSQETATRTWNGSLDGLTFFDRPWTAGDFAAHYAEGLAGQPTTLNRVGPATFLMMGAAGGGAGSTPISGADTGTGTDSGSVVVAVAATDAGTGTDAGTIVAAVSSSDTGTGADSGSLVASVAATDSGAGTDSGSVVVAVAATDAGVGSDAGSVFSGQAVSGSDSGTGTDAGTLVAAVSATDAGAGTDAGSLVVSVSASDSGTGTDAGSVFSGQSVSSSDTGTGSDAGSVVASVSASDPGAGADAGSVVAAVASSDSGAGSDTGTVVVAVSASDSGTGSDSGSISTPAPTAVPPASPTWSWLLRRLRRRRRPVAPAYNPLIRRAVVAAMLADDTLAALVGTNVFPGRVDEAVDLGATPAATYQMISNRRGQNLLGPSGISTARFQVAACAKDATRCEAIAEAIRNLFDGYAGLLGGLVTVFETTQQDERDAQEPPDDGTAQGVYRAAVDYTFRYREPMPSR